MPYHTSPKIWTSLFDYSIYIAEWVVDSVDVDQ